MLNLFIWLYPKLHLNSYRSVFLLLAMKLNIFSRRYLPATVSFQFVMCITLYKNYYDSNYTKYTASEDVWRLAKWICSLITLNYFLCLVNFVKIYICYQISSASLLNNIRSDAHSFRSRMFAAITYYNTYITRRGYTRWSVQTAFQILESCISFSPLCTM